MQPRLKLDIGWRDLASIWLPVRRQAQTYENDIAAHAPDGVFPVAALSVRSLFLALLEERGDSRPVAISAVNVADMAALARSKGCALRPIDVAIDSLMPSPAVARATCGHDAGMLVLAHLYGTRPDIGPIAAACAAPDRLIVEDCAQAFDGGLRLSPGADVALYSFGPIKTATALGGAVGLFRDPVLAEGVRRRMADWPARGDGWFLRRSLKYAGLKLAGSPVFYGLVFALLARLAGDPEPLIGSFARSFSGQPIEQAARHRPPTRLLRLLARRLKSWPKPRDAIGTMLHRLSCHVIVPGLAARPTHWWLAPVVAHDPERLIARLRAQGYDATRGTTSMRALAGETGLAPETASRLMANVVYLPKPRDAAAAERLADTVERACE